MYIIIKTTTSSQSVCNKIVDEVLNNNLSPCAHISLITSKYKWKNKINNKNEYLLDIKTIKKYQKKIIQLIHKNHNYEIPEIISIDFNILNNDYKEWFNENI